MQHTIASPEIPGTPREGAAEALATQAARDALAAARQLVAAKEFADRLGTRRRASGAPVRNLFAVDDTGGRTSLAALLNGGKGGGGGRGGQLRVKLYLSLLWVCAKEPYEAIRPARAWAGLLGLDDGTDRGVRRVQETLRELQARGFVELRDRGGHPSAVTVLEETGAGAGYTPPSDAYNRLSQAGADPDDLRQHNYFKVPSALWTSGYIARLGGPGLAMLLVLLCEQRGQVGQPVWFSPDTAQRRYGLAESTRRDGLQQLRELGLVHTTKRVISEGGAYIDFQRRRNVHTLTLDALTPPTAALTVTATITAGAAVTARR